VAAAHVCFLKILTYSDGLGEGLNRAGKVALLDLFLPLAEKASEFA
jgi:hypothetical protein